MKNFASRLCAYSVSNNCVHSGKIFSEHERTYVRLLGTQEYLKCCWNSSTRKLILIGQFSKLLSFVYICSLSKLRNYAGPSFWVDKSYLKMPKIHSNFCSASRTSIWRIFLTQKISESDEKWNAKLDQNFVDYGMHFYIFKKMQNTKKNWETCSLSPTRSILTRFYAILYWLRKIWKIGYFRLCFILTKFLQKLNSNLGNIFLEDFLKIIFFLWFFDYF